VSLRHLLVRLDATTCEALQAAAAQQQLPHCPIGVPAWNITATIVDEELVIGNIDTRECVTFSCCMVSHFASPSHAITQSRVDFVRRYTSEMAIFSHVVLLQCDVRRVRVQT
jgi:hypothetical protein